MVTTLYDAMRASIEAFSDIQPGCNGPWGVPDNGLRNTAHWLIAFAWGYRTLGEKRYKDKAWQLGQSLLSKEYRPCGYSFLHLPKHSYPENGLIGQAWTIEALITAAQTLEDSLYTDVAAKVFTLHRFCPQRGLWHILRPDGQIAEVHSTLNQQVWFAAMGIQLAHMGYSIPKDDIECFMNKIDENIKIVNGGLLGMKIAGAPYPAPNLARRLLSKLRSGSRSTYFPFREVSVGYHAFTLYGFGLLKSLMPNHPFWQSDKLQRALKWGCSRRHQRALRRNRFAMGYNPSGIEMPYVLQVFFADRMDYILSESRWWIREQLRRHFNPETGLLSRNSPDPHTLAARIYEAIRLSEPLLNLSLNGERGR